MKNYIGLDIGGTGIKIGVVNENLELVYKNSFPTRTRDGSDAIMKDITNECKKLIKSYDIECIGVGCPGDKDDSNTAVVMAGNLPFRNLPIVEILKSATGKEVFLDNDGQCALVAEWLAGCGKGCKDMVEITIGTGIGGGCVVNGDLLRGTNNDGGELGHFVIDPHGEKCQCGQKGCFEKFASATALIRYTREAIVKHPESILAREGKDGVDGRTVFNAYNKNCPVAANVLRKYCKYLAIGINGLTYIFAPETIALAGGIINQGDIILKFASKYLLHPELVKTTTLHGDAGIIGAALLHRFSNYYFSLRK